MCISFQISYSCLLYAFSAYISLWRTGPLLICIRSPVINKIDARFLSIFFFFSPNKIISVLVGCFILFWFVFWKKGCHCLRLKVKCLLLSQAVVVATPTVSPGSLCYLATRVSDTIWGTQFPLCKCSEIEHWGSPLCSVALSRKILHCRSAVMLEKLRHKCSESRQEGTTSVLLELLPYGNRCPFCLGKVVTSVTFDTLVCLLPGTQPR